MTVIVLTNDPSWKGQMCTVAWCASVDGKPDGEVDSEQGNVTPDPEAVSPNN